MRSKISINESCLPVIRYINDETTSITRIRSIWLMSDNATLKTCLTLHSIFLSVEIGWENGLTNTTIPYIAKYTVNIGLYCNVRIKLFNRKLTIGLEILCEHRGIALIKGQSKSNILTNCKKCAYWKHLHGISRHWIKFVQEENY